MERTTINERVQILLDKLGMNKNSFAVKIGVTPTTVGNIVRSITKPSFELIERILDAFPKVSEKWLVRGIGPMFITDEPNSVSKITIPDYLEKHLSDIENNWKRVVDEKNSTIQGLIYTIDVLRQTNQLPGKQLVNEKKSAVMRVSHNVFDRSVNSLVNTGS